MIHTTMARLSPKLREVLILREYEELSLAEMAHVLKCSRRTVKERLALARKEIRPYIEALLEGKSC